MFLRSYSVVFFMVHVNLTHPLCGIFPGLIAWDSISPDKQEVSGKMGGTVTLRCCYDSSDEYVILYWDYSNWYNLLEVSIIK